MTFPSVVLGSYLTITAKRWGQIPTITLVDGGTAGSEVVTMDASFNITVKIASGTSTNLQIKNAILAVPSDGSGLSVNDLVSVAITAGHNAGVQVAGVSVPMAGGVTTAVKASLIIGPIQLQAKTAGTGGNSIRFKFTGGATAGSEVVTVSTNDVTVQIQDGVSSWGQIKDAVAGDTGANALIAITSTGPGLYTMPTYAALDSPGATGKRAAHVTDCASFTNLAGGVAVAPAAVVLQGVTVTSNTNDATQNGRTLTYTGGATAGAEVVSFDASGNISVQIQSGTSTITQVRTALNADGTFSPLYTATGTSSTTVLANTSASLSGSVGPSISGGALGFYQDQAGVTLTTTFQYAAFGNEMGAMSIYNDETSGSKTVIWSYDGINNHGSLLPTQSVQLMDVNKGGIYIKEANGAPAYRVFAAAH